MKIKTATKAQFSKIAFWFLGLTLPMQFGKHFWFKFSYLSGVKIDYLSPTIYLVDFFLIFIFFLSFLKTSFYWQKIIKKRSKLLLIILILVGFSYFIALFKGLFWYRLYQYLKIALTAYLFSQIKKNDFKNFLNGLFTAICLAIVLSIAQIINQQSLQGLWYYTGERSFTITSPAISTVSIGGKKLLRAYAFFSHPNSLAGFFLPFIYLYLYFKKPIPAILCALLVILSFSKFAICLLAITLIFWFVKKNCRLCFLAQLGLGAWLIFFSFFLKGNPQSLFIRGQGLVKTVTTVVNNPLGVGLGHFLHKTPLSLYQPVHNIFLLITLEWGALVWLLVIPKAKQLLAKIKQDKLFIVFAIIIVLSGSFDHYWLTLNQNMLLLGVIIGLISQPRPKWQTLSLFLKKT